MIRFSITIGLILILFTGCFNSQKSIDYTNHFFVIDNKVSLTTQDIEKIEYHKSEFTSNAYNIDVNLTQKGLDKLNGLFKNAVGKSIGLVVNNHTIQFDIPVLENIFEDDTDINNKMIHFQFDEYNTKLFLKSFNIDFQK